MSNFIIATIRTLVPIVVGWLVAQLALANIPVDQPTVDGLILSVSTLVASLYYVAVAWLERRWPWFGWLLGVARNPVYSHSRRTGDTSDPRLATFTVEDLRAELAHRIY